MHKFQEQVMVNAEQEINENVGPEKKDQETNTAIPYPDNGEHFMRKELTEDEMLDLLRAQDWKFVKDSPLKVQKIKSKKSYHRRKTITSTKIAKKKKWLKPRSGIVVMMKKEHNTKMNVYANSNKVIRCLECKKCFVGLIAMKIHYRMKHLHNIKFVTKLSSDNKAKKIKSVSLTKIPVKKKVEEAVSSSTSSSSKSGRGRGRPRKSDKKQEVQKSTTIQDKKSTSKNSSKSIVPKKSEEEELIVNIKREPLDDVESSDASFLLNSSFDEGSYRKSRRLSQKPRQDFAKLVGIKKELDDEGHTPNKTKGSPTKVRELSSSSKKLLEKQPKVALTKVKIEQNATPEVVSKKRGRKKKASFETTENKDDEISITKKTPGKTTSKHKTDKLDIDLSDALLESASNDITIKIELDEEELSQLSEQVNKGKRKLEEEDDQDDWFNIEMSSEKKPSKKKKVTKVIKEKSEDTQNVTFVICSLCEIKCANVYNLKEHSMRKHIQKKDPEWLGPGYEMFKKMFICKKCGKPFLFKKEYTMHEQSEHNKTMFYCPVETCDIVSPHEDAVKNHQVSENIVVFIHTSKHIYVYIHVDLYYIW